MTEILPVRPSVVTSPPVSESNPSSAPPAEFSVRSDMPPSPTPVRDLVTAHLAEHPDEHPALLGGGRAPQDGTLPDTARRALREEAGPEVADLRPYAVEDAAPTPSGAVPHIVGVHLYLERDGLILLGRRHPDSAYAGGSWHALAGHCEAESATACLVREAYEEAGLVIDREDLELVHTVHVVDRPGDRDGDRPPRIQLFFRASRFEGTPELREPDKCVAWQWWNPEGLPEPVVPYTRAAVEGIRAGRPYTESGWAR
ncbi:NUDIX hydrolase [Streptomyces sp. NBC_00691]|uniref:NUDIX hydrolase n=1 Tax=Streptomyces sp. NBC_00691 TaxID=2903671 RepID=UPI002E32310A|nr:NUDIX domain-containing protein [Streptomyces sp. NBC_00691]